MNQKKSTRTAEQSQILAVHISIFFAVLLFLISLVVGILSDSVVLLLDASAGLVTILVAFFMRKIIKTLNKPADSAFHFGYGKYEPLTVTLQGAMIILSCIIAGKFAIQDIIHPEHLARYDLPAITSIFLCIMSLAMFLYLKKVSKSTRSSMLKMASLHWFIDSSMSLGMFIGFGFGALMLKLGLTHIAPYVDPVMTLILIAFFIKSPVEAIMHNGVELLDMVPPKEDMKKITQITEKHKARSFGIHRIRARKAGQKLFIDICFLVEGNTPVKKAEELAKDFEKDITSHFPNSDVVVYFKSPQP